MRDRDTRLGSDSNGSTRAAFFPERLVAPRREDRDRCKKGKEDEYRVPTLHRVHLDGSNNCGELTPLRSQFDSLSPRAGISNQVSFDYEPHRPPSLRNSQRQNSQQSEILGIDLLDDSQGHDLQYKNQTSSSEDESPLVPLMKPSNVQRRYHSDYGTRALSEMKKPSSQINDGEYVLVHFVHGHRDQAQILLKLQNCSGWVGHQTRYVVTAWTNWLRSGIVCDTSDVHPGAMDGSGEVWSIARLIRVLFFNPLDPEFTLVQLFIWSVVIGLIMGVYSATWRQMIEYCTDFVWVYIPETLLQHGVFSDAEGSFPVSHYVWMAPCMIGGLLAYLQSLLSHRFPGQDDWIRSIHSRGVLAQESGSFLLLTVLATASMSSGLSLGPEVPLILTASKVGTWIAFLCNQSILRARILNLTAASAAFGSFFRFPVAGAFFVLELPHRSGLQYFEALVSKSGLWVFFAIRVTNETHSYKRFVFFRLQALFRQSWPFLQTEQSLELNGLAIYSSPH